jgi:hypothetical protein
MDKADVIVARAVRLAVEAAETEPPVVGSVVAHADHKRTARLVSYDGAQVVVREVEGNEVRWPRKGLLDPNEAERIAFEIFTRQMHERAARQ